MLPCTQNDDSLQQARCRLRETIIFRRRPSQGEPLQNRAGANLALTQADGPKNIASRAGKTLICFVQLETGGPEGPQNRCSRAGETTTFPKRYALVQVKQYYLQFGSCWDGPGLAQGVGPVFARAAPCRAESGMATHRPMLPCGRNANVLQKARSRLRKATIQAC